MQCTAGVRHPYAVRLLTPYLLVGALVGVSGGCSGTLVSPGDSGEDEVAGNCEVELSPLRRLSHFEYRNSLADLFPNTELPELALPDDPKPHEFDNHAESLRASQSLVSAYSVASKDVASAALASEEFAGCTPSGESEVQGCGEEFVEQLGRRVFRRPLTAEQVEFFSVFFREAPNGASYADRQELTLQLMLSAPEFLYRFERSANPDAAPGTRARVDGYSMASRLSYFLWGTMPDEALFAAAESGALETEEGIAAEVDRMVASDRAKANFVHFHNQWLDFGRIASTTKADEDGLDEELRASMQESAERFVETVLFDERGSVEDLFRSPRVFADQRIADLIGATIPSGEEWAEVEAEGRAGLLTHPLFLASHGHPDKASPVLRGVSVLERVLCSELGSPPPNAEAAGAAAAEELVGPYTNRELYTAMTTEETCQSCHTRINAAGFAFEQFDTMGRFRLEEESGLTIDPSASLDQWSFENASDFAQQISSSEEVARCVTKKWVRYAYAGSDMERSSCLLDELMDSVAEGDGSIRSLMSNVVTHPAFATFVVPEVQ